MKLEKKFLDLYWMKESNPRFCSENNPLGASKSRRSLVKEDVIYKISLLNNDFSRISINDI